MSQIKTLKTCISDFLQDLEVLPKFIEDSAPYTLLSTKRGIKTIKEKYSQSAKRLILAWEIYKIEHDVPILDIMNFIKGGLI